MKRIDIDGLEFNKFSKTKGHWFKSFNNTFIRKLKINIFKLKLIKYRVVSIIVLLLLSEFFFLNLGKFEMLNVSQLA